MPQYQRLGFNESNDMVDHLVASVIHLWNLRVYEDFFDFGQDVAVFAHINREQFMPRQYHRTWMEKLSAVAEHATKPSLCEVRNALSRQLLQNASRRNNNITIPHLQAVLNELDGKAERIFSQLQALVDELDGKAEGRKAENGEDEDGEDEEVKEEDGEGGDGEGGDGEGEDGGGGDGEGEDGEGEDVEDDEVKEEDDEGEVSRALSSTFHHVKQQLILNFEQSGDVQSTAVPTPCVSRSSSAAIVKNEDQSQGMPSTAAGKVPMSGSGQKRPRDVEITIDSTAKDAQSIPSKRRKALASTSSPDQPVPTSVQDSHQPAAAVQGSASSNEPTDERPSNGQRIDIQAVRLQRNITECQLRLAEHKLGKAMKERLEYTRPLDLEMNKLQETMDYAVAQHVDALPTVLPGLGGFDFREHVNRMLVDYREYMSRQREKDKDFAEINRTLDELTNAARKLKSELRELDDTINQHGEQ
jgi:hypothetical protein